jgi:hypothetical protein
MPPVKAVGQAQNAFTIPVPCFVTNSTIMPLRSGCRPVLLSHERRHAGVCVRPAVVPGKTAQRPDIIETDASSHIRGMERQTARAKVRLGADGSRVS